MNAVMDEVREGDATGTHLLSDGLGLDLHELEALLALLGVLLELGFLAQPGERTLAGVDGAHAALGKLLLIELRLELCCRLARALRQQLGHLVLVALLLGLWGGVVVKGQRRNLQPRLADLADCVWVDALNHNLLVRQGG